MGRCDCPWGLMDFRESSLPYRFGWPETDRHGPLSAAASASEPWRARHHGAPVGTMVGVASFHGHAAFALPDFGQMRVFNAAKGRIPKTEDSLLERNRLEPAVPTDCRFETAYWTVY